MTFSTASQGSRSPAARHNDSARSPGDELPGWARFDWLAGESLAEPVGRQPVFRTTPTSTPSTRAFLT